MKIKSPVTHGDNVRKIESINVQDIAKVYNNIGIENVRRFFSGIDQVNIFECLDTHYRFYHPFSIFGDEKFYASLQNMAGYYGDWRWEHNVTYEKIKHKQDILEIGCGTGNFIEKIKKEKNANCVGLELNRQAIEKAKSRGLTACNETIEQHSINSKNKYDAVCSFQVLEHVYDVKSFLENSIACLKKDGLLIIGVPNNNPYLFQNDKFHALNLPPHHMGLWDGKSLKSIEKYFNVKLISLMFEPLFDIDYFWGVKKEFWKKNNGFFYFFANYFPNNPGKWRNKFLQKICNGRNILAIYSKK